MIRLTRDGTAEPVSRDQILRHARGQGNIIFPVQLTTSRIGNLTRLIHTLLYVMTIHTYIHTVKTYEFTFIQNLKTAISNRIKSIYLTHLKSPSLVASDYRICFIFLVVHDARVLLSREKITK